MLFSTAEFVHKNSGVSSNSFVHVRLPVSTKGRLHRYAYLAALIAIDALMLMLAFFVAYGLRFAMGITFVPEVQPIAQDYTKLATVLIPAWLALFVIMGLYDYRILLGGTTEYARAFNACTGGIILVVLTSFFDTDLVISRAWLVLSWCHATLFVVCGRLCLRRIAYALRAYGYFTTPAILVGTNQEAMALAAQFSDRVASGLLLVGAVATDDEQAHHAQALKQTGLAVLGQLDAICDLVTTHSVTEVIVATTALDRMRLLALFEELNRMPTVSIRLSSGLYEVMTTGMRVHTLGAVPLMSVNSLRLDRVEWMLKTLLDYSFSLVVLLLFSPIMLIIGLLIKVDSPGPMIYRRRVLGVGGKEFDAFKFRTMAVNGDELLARYPELMAELQANHKLQHDPRITRMGHWLRKTSLDELPQLFNVLLGQMSLVGPRMISPVEGAEYGRYKFNLLTVKPGLTGLWQVSGRADVSYEQRVQLDMHYIRNYTVWRDLQILLIQTLPAVLKRRGAY